MLVQTDIKYHFLVIAVLNHPADLLSATAAWVEAIAAAAAHTLWESLRNPTIAISIAIS